MVGVLRNHRENFYVGCLFTLSILKAWLSKENLCLRCESFLW